MANSDSIYPAVPRDVGDPQNFRLRKICDVQTTLDREIDHYRLVQKKYKRLRRIAQGTAFTFGSVATITSSAGLGVSTTGIGVVVGGPLAGIAGIFGLVGVAAGVVSQKLNGKVSKHEDTMVLAQSKKNTINEPVSKALENGEVSDEEFRLILREQEQYIALKASLRSRAPKNTAKSSAKKREKRRNQLREIRQKYGSAVFD